MTAPQFHLSAPADSPMAQRALLALKPRGSDLAAKPSVRRDMCVALHVVLTTGETITVRDDLAMIELIENLHADQPFHPQDPARRARHRELMIAVMRAQTRFDALLASRTSRDLDLAHHFLHEALLPVEADAEPPPAKAHEVPSNLDIVTLPLLWRILLLDRLAGTHIARRLPRLRDRAVWLMRQSAVSPILTDALAQGFLTGLHRAGAAVVQKPETDWSRLCDDEGDGPRLAHQSASAAHRNVQQFPGR